MFRPDAAEAVRNNLRKAARKSPILHPPCFVIRRYTPTVPIASSAHAYRLDVSPFAAMSHPELADAGFLGSKPDGLPSTNRGGDFVSQQPRLSNRLDSDQGQIQTSA